MENTEIQKCEKPCQAHKCMKIAKFGVRVLTLMATICIAKQLHRMNHNVESFAREQRRHRKLL